jgi:protein-disulfide isomerase
MAYLFRSLLLACLLLPVAQPADYPKPAIDKQGLETYIRDLFGWGPQINLAIADPKPSSLPGMLEVNVHATAGTASQDEVFYVSKDGQKKLRGLVFDVAKNPFQSDLDKLKTDRQPDFGTPGAPVVLVLFSDFQCPFCKDEAKMLRANLLAAYPQQVRVYFKDLPLEQLHPWAKPAAIAGRCVFNQKPAAFWDYHDWIYEHQESITADNFRAKALEAVQGKELDPLQLGRCMDTKATEAEVAKSVAESRELKIMSTPMLFVNGRRLSTTAWPDLKQIIDDEIEYQKTAKNAGEDCGCVVPAPSLPK